MNRMNFRMTATAAALALGLGAAGAMTAMAGQNADAEDTAEVQAFLASPMSAADAIKAAEASAGGKTMSVEFDTEDLALGAYVVELAMADGTTSTVAVNPADGTVTAVSDDDNDHGDREDDDDDEETDDDGDKN